jgi:glycosyltransferase involved in cell wall biosynthesis
MPAPPCVSVVLPVFNGGPYLVEALESLLAQSLTDFELIAFDDDSIDECLRKCPSTT